MTAQVRTRSARGGLTAFFALATAFVLMVFTGALTAPWSAADPTAEPTVSASSEFSTTAAADCSLLLTAKPTGVTPVKANDSDSWTITYAVAKGDCSRVDASQFKLTASPASTAVSFSAVTKQADGSFRATATSTQAGNFSVVTTVTSGENSSTLDTLSIPFTSSAASPVDSSLTATPSEAVVPCDETVEVKARALVKTTEDEPASFVPVTFTYGVSGSTTQTIAATTDLDGIASITINASATSKPLAISATIVSNGTATAIGEPVSVTLTSATNCTSQTMTITPTSGSTVPADGKSTWTAKLVVVNSKGEPVTGGAANVRFRGAVNGEYYTTFLTSTIIETSPGTYEATLASTAPMTYEVTGYYGSTPTTAQDVTFTALTPDITKSTLAVTPTSVTMPCDGTTTEKVQAVVTLLDASGTPVVGVQVALKASQAVGTADATATTGSEGKATFTVPVNGNYPDTTMTINATVQIGGKAVAIKGSPASVSLPRAAGCAATPAHANAVPSPGIQSLGMPIDLTVTIFDSKNQLIKDLDPTKMAFTTSSAVTVGAIKNNGDGSYSATLLSNTAGTYTINIAYDGTKFTFPKPLTVTYREGSTFFATPATQQAGESVALKLTLIDSATGEPYDKIDVTFSSSVATDTFSDTTVTTDKNGVAQTTLTGATAGTRTIHAKAKLADGTVGDVVTAISVEYTGSVVTPTPAAPTFEVVRTGGAATVLADGAASWTGRVTVTDADDAPVANLTAGDFAFTSSPSGVTVSDVKNNGAGVYTVTFTSTKAGSFAITPSVQGFPAVAAQTISFEALPEAQVSFDNPVDNASLTTGLPLIAGTSTVTPVIVSENGITLCVAEEIGADGSWACQLAAPLTDGIHTLTATAGTGDNTATAKVTVRVDTTAPATPVITSPRDGATLAAPAQAVVVSGTAEADAAVTVTEAPVGTAQTKASNTCSDKADANGAWSCELAPLSAGRHQVSVIATDAALHTSAAATLTLTQEAGPTQSPSGTQSPTSSPSDTSSPTSSPSDTGTPTGSPSPTDSPTSSPSDTSSPTPSDTGTPTSKPSETGTPTSSPSDTGTPTGSPSPTDNPTDTPTGNPSDTGTPTSSPSSTDGPTSTPSDTSSPTSTPSGTDTPTGNPTETPTSSGTPSTTSTPTGDIRNCGDFTYQQDAQAWLDAHPSNVDQLDGDGDSIACEDLSSAPTQTPTTGQSGTSNTPAAGGKAATGGSATPTPGWSGLIPLALGCALAAAVGARRLRKVTN